MNKRSRTVLYLVIFLSFLVVSIWTVYNVYIVPNREVRNSYAEVYQELEEDINSIVINSVNQNLVIKPSEDAKIHIAYYQKTQPDFASYSVSGSTVTLNMLQRMEDMDSPFIPDSGQLATITVYLPADNPVSIRYTSVEGEVRGSDVVCKSLNFSSRNGSVEINHVSAGSLSVSANFGRITIANSDFSGIVLNSVSGSINLDLMESLDLYQGHLETLHGTLSVNGNRIQVTSEDGNKVTVNALILDGQEANKKATVTSERGNITVTSDETSESNEE